MKLWSVNCQVFPLQSLRLWDHGQLSKQWFSSTGVCRRPTGDWASGTGKMRQSWQQMQCQSDFLVWPSFHPPHFLYTRAKHFIGRMQMKVFVLCRKDWTILCGKARVLFHPWGRSLTKKKDTGVGVLVKHGCIACKTWKTPLQPPPPLPFARIWEPLH